jgi:hypothetical protein
LAKFNLHSGYFRTKTCLDRQDNHSPNDVERTMTPQERQLIDDLFGRLEKLETAPRDAEAEAAIMAGLRRAPNAVYALVQTALLQDEALKHAAARIEQLEAGEHPQNQGSFLDSLRGSLFGGNAPSSQGSVPNVPPSNPNARPVWNSGQVLGQADGYSDPRATPGGYAQPGYGAPQAQGGGSSFLGTAAAAAAGMIGGSILMNSFRGLGGGQQQSFGNTNPWGVSSGNSSDTLARDAGINDVGKNNSGGIEDRRQSFADQAQDAQQDRDDDQDQDQDDDDGDFDDGGFDSDDSDFA